MIFLMTPIEFSRLVLFAADVSGGERVDAARLVRRGLSSLPAKTMERPEGRPVSYRYSVAQPVPRGRGSRRDTPARCPCPRRSIVSNLKQAREFVVILLFKWYTELIKDPQWNDI